MQDRLFVRERYSIQPTPTVLGPVIVEAPAKLDDAVLGQQDFASIVNRCSIRHVLYRDAMLLLTDRSEPRTIAEIADDVIPTRRALLTVGEQLIGEMGLEGIALHRVAQVAGQANKYAVQYHFGNLDGFIEAIFQVRLRRVEARRQSLLDAAAARGLMDSLPALLETVFLPMSEQVDDKGRHSYARFRLQHKSRPLHGPENPILIAPRPGATETAFRAIAAAANISLTDTVWRMMLLDSMLISALIDRDNAAIREQEAPALEDTVAGMVAIAAASITFPGWPPRS